MTRQRARLSRIALLVLASFSLDVTWGSAASAASRAIPGLFGGSYGRPAPASSQLPTGANVIQGAAATPTVTGTRMVIQQTDAKAILEWLTFDVGQGAEVHFDQTKNGKAQTDWVALNRIKDLNPSQIFGKLTADGKVFLINQNGILFGPTATVNVHSLLASSLNIKNADFLADSLNFGKDSGGNDVTDYQGTGSTPGPVSNHGRIETDALGSVFLFAPQVENNGVIVSPTGQIALAAGTTVFLSPRTDGRGLLVQLTAPAGSTATNFELGQLLAETGLVGMYGWAVNQQGLIRSTTAIKRNGAIELLASNRVDLGPTSVTATPVSDSKETANQTFPFVGGTVTVGGLETGTAPAVVNVQGTIQAPSGTVTLNADGRVFLDSGSRIDVSGNWVDRPAGDAAVTATLNSVQLRDDQQQKGGFLQGRQITFDPTVGSSIGDISESLGAQDLTALQRSTKGGSVFFDAGSTGEVVAKQGSSVAFAGGGFRYQPGTMNITKLISKGTVYDIGSAPSYLKYDGILTVGKPVGGRIEGADAGSLSVKAKTIRFESALNGSVTAGALQTQASESLDSRGLLATYGRRRPQGGTVAFGDKEHGGLDSTRESRSPEVEVLFVESGSGALPDRLGPDDALPAFNGRQDLSVVSAESLSAAGLSNLGFYATEKVTVDQGASLRVTPGGAVSAYARGIELRGAIQAPAGSVSLVALDNATTDALLPDGSPNPRYVAGVQDRLLLATGSSIDVSGLSADNSGARTPPPALSKDLLKGGTVTLRVATAADQDAIVQNGAHVNANGGYEVRPGGAVTAGAGGGVTIAGSTVVLEGDVSALSAPGATGGSLTVHATGVTVEASGTPVPGVLPDDFSFAAAVPDSLHDRFVMASDRFASSGFASIELRAEGDLLVRSGADLAPSVLKTKVPNSALGGSALNPPGAVDDGKGHLLLPSELLGATSLALKAGTTLTGRVEPVPLTSSVTVEADTRVRAAPGGSVSLSGPDVSVAGALSAPGGAVALSATRLDALEGQGKGAVTLLPGAVLSAAGYVTQGSATAAQGAPANEVPHAGGKISLSAPGDVTAGESSLIDVSGPRAVTQTTRMADGTLGTLKTSAGAGTLSLSYGQSLALDGEIRATVGLAGTQGGTVSVRNTLGTLTVAQSDFDRWLGLGFDSLSFSGATGLGLTGDVNALVPRSLTLDAPSLSSSGSAANQRLESAYVNLKNSWELPSAAAQSGDATLQLRGRQGIDVAGSVALSGFAQTTLSSDRDVVVEDRFYGGSQGTWAGALSTVGNLDIVAQRLYPSTLSRFDIQAGDELHVRRPGTATDTSPVYSAGGELRLSATNVVEQAGTVLAPMGTLEVRATGATGRVYLADGSVTSVAGSADVSYGTLGELTWTTADKGSSNPTTTIDVNAAPSKNLTLSGAEVVARGGAQVDASGGGSVFSSFFAPGVQGSFNPLDKVQILLPAGTGPVTGNAVEITQGVPGLAPGVYSILPSSFAFVPGAIAIQSLGTRSPAAAGSRETAAGYPIASGFSTTPGTGLRASALQDYAVRPASDVLKEGDFTVRRFDADGGGAVSAAAAQSMVLEGAVSAAGVKGASGGTVALSAKDVVVQGTGTQLGAGFDVATPLPADLVGKLILSTKGLTGRGISAIQLGDEQTSSVTVRDGAQLSAPEVSLVAAQSVSIEGGSRVEGSGAQGKVTLASRGAGTAVVSVDATSTVQAGAELDLEASSLALNGSVQTQGGLLAVTSPTLRILENGSSGQGLDGALLTPAMLASTQAADFRFTAGTELTLQGTVSLAATGSLEIETPRIGAVAGAGPAKATLAAGSLQIGNSTGGVAAADARNGGAGSELVLQAGGMEVSRGDVKIDGFDKVGLQSAGDLKATGAGSLVSSGALTLTAARITTDGRRDPTTGRFQNADYEFKADGQSLTLASAPSPGASQSATAAGGTLRFTGSRVDDSALVEVRGGRVDLTATGTGPDDGAVIRTGGKIDVRGDANFGGGRVSLQAGAGPVKVEAGASIDVSAPETGSDPSGNPLNAGSLRLSAPGGDVRVAGTLVAGAKAGAGGSLWVDGKTVGAATADAAGLLGAANASGFSDGVSVRARTGDVAVPTGLTLSSREVSLVADSGSLTIDGSIAASGPVDGGVVRLYSGGNLVVNGTIEAGAANPGASGGTVELGAGLGSRVVVAAGARVDVAGGTAATGGSVYVRAPRTASGDDIAFDLSGTVSGANSVVAEAYKVYNAAAVDQTLKDAINADGSTFGAAASTVSGRLSSHVQSGTLSVIPGAEVRATGDLALTQDWDLTTARFGGEPGALWLRAVGNLTLGTKSTSAKLVDHPTLAKDLVSATPGLDSWNLALVAGADFGSADPLATVRGTGTLELKSQSLAYSESGSVSFASGGDTIIGPGTAPGYMDAAVQSHLRYNLGTYDGRILGQVGRNLTISAGAVQSALGDIRVDVGGDLDLARANEPNAAGNSSLGSIRTTGKPATAVQALQYWTYADGGDIDLRVGGTATSGAPSQGFSGSPTVPGVASAASDGWDALYVPKPSSTDLHWSASFDQYRATEGLATMGGGDLTVRAGGSFFGQAGTFGKGDLRVEAYGDLDLGRVVVNHGTGVLSTTGNYDANLANRTLEAFAAHYDVTAEGDIRLGSIVNPTVALPGPVWGSRLTYSEDASARLSSVAGDVSLTGVTPYTDSSSPFAQYGRILPPVTEISAGRDLVFSPPRGSGASYSFVLAPSPTGDLRLTAGRDIVGAYTTDVGGLGRVTLVMSDQNPDTLYGQSVTGSLLNALTDRLRHGTGTPLHEGQPGRPKIEAGRDIDGLTVGIPKPFDVRAGRDIDDLTAAGQTFAATDTSSIRAGRDLRLGTRDVDTGSDMSGILSAGPGTMVVGAAGVLDLGSTEGIQSIANQRNAWLDAQGGDLVVLAGYSQDVTPAQVSSFFQKLQESGILYSDLLQQGKTAEAKAEVDQIRADVIVPLLGEGVSAEEPLQMVRSQIATRLGGNIRILVDGAADVGKSSFTSESVKQSTGIFTASGGNVDVFAKRDVNVNEARVMTFRGGDVLVWSDLGSINAGRGSKAAINVQPPQLVPIFDSHGNLVGYSSVFSPPSVGSGIRTLTYDPDGVEGPLQAPTLGDAYLFAPQGIIDAGEAGIAGKNVILAATQVLNAQNITFSTGSVGVPVASQSLGLGSLAGSGAVADAQKQAQAMTTAALESPKTAQTQGGSEEMSQMFTPKSLKVDIIGFDEDEGSPSDPGTDEKKKQKKK